MTFNEDCSELSYVSWEYTVDPLLTPENYFQYEMINQVTCTLADDVEEEEEQEAAPDVVELDGCDGGRPAGVYSCTAACVSFIGGQFIPIVRDHVFVFPPPADPPSPVFASDFVYNASQAVTEETSLLLSARTDLYSDAAICAVDPAYPDQFTCADAADATVRSFRVLDGSCEALAFIGGEALVEQNATIQGQFFGFPFAHTGACVEGEGPDALEASRSLLSDALERRSCEPAAAYDCSYVSLKKDMVSGNIVEVEGDGVMEIRETGPGTFVRTFTRDGLYLDDGNPDSDVFDRYNGSDFSSACAYAVDGDPSRGPVAHCWQVSQGAMAVLRFSNECSELSVTIGEPLLDAPDRHGDGYGFEYPYAGVMRCASR